MSKQLAGALGALALIGGVALTGAVPAVATGGQGCPTTVITGTEGVSTSGDATAVVTGQGLRLRTPVKASRARWQTGFTGNAFANLGALSYRTFTHSDGDRGFATVAARVGLDTDSDGAADTTLVYEPYFNGTVTEGEWQSWDAINGGAAKWWWSEEPGNPQTNRPWSEYQALYPDALLTFVNVGLGTWNEGADARVDELRVAVKARGTGCQKWKWKKPPVTPSATPSMTASPSVSASPTATATADPGPTTTPTGSPTASPSVSESPVPVPTISTSPAAGGGGSGLPLTGTPLALIGGGGLLLIAVGGGLFLVSRRRRDEGSEFAA